MTFLCRKVCFACSDCFRCTCWLYWTWSCGSCLEVLACTTAWCLSWSPVIQDVRPRQAYVGQPFVSEHVESGARSIHQVLQIQWSADGQGTLWHDVSPFQYLHLTSPSWHSNPLDYVSESFASCRNDVNVDLIAYNKDLAIQLVHALIMFFMGALYTILGPTPHANHKSNTSSIKKGKWHWL